MAQAQQSRLLWIRAGRQAPFPPRPSRLSASPRCSRSGIFPASPHPISCPGGVPELGPVPFRRAPLPSARRESSSVRRGHPLGRRGPCAQGTYQEPHVGELPAHGADPRVSAAASALQRALWSRQMPECTRTRSLRTRRAAEMHKCNFIPHQVRRKAHRPQCEEPLPPRRATLARLQFPSASPVGVSALTLNHRPQLQVT